MFKRWHGLTLFAAVLAVAAGGCKKSSSPEASKSPPPAPKPAKIETVARVQWLGKKQVSADTNSAGLIPIWDHPDTVRLQNQTLDKLSLAPWLLLKGQTNDAAANLLRSLMEDLVQEESYLEIRNAGNEPGELVFAIKTGPTNAGLWQTNLASALENLTQLKVAAATNGWVLTKHDRPNRIEQATAGSWTVVGLANTTNALMAQVIQQISSTGSPSTNGFTNAWFEAFLDLPRVSSALGLGWKIPPTWPRISISSKGDGENIRSRGYAEFAQSLPLKLQPWVVPQQIVREPLISFTAVQGIKAILTKVLSMTGPELDPVPDQLYSWALLGLPFQQFLAVPVDNGPAAIERWSTNVLPWANRLIPPDAGQVTLTNSSLVWTGFIAFTPPRLEPVMDNSNHFALLTMFPLPPSKPAPMALLGQVMNRTNLVYYDWELTSERLTQLRFLHDTRYVFFDPSHKPRLDNETATAKWFQTCLTNLGNTGTEVTLVSSNRLQFARNSKIGFSALELHLLENWLESPRFPEPNISPKLRTLK